VAQAVAAVEMAVAAEEIVIAGISDPVQQP
jgi:hypothetical protein